MWRNYVAGLLDYNSQLWSPVDQIKMSSLEQLLRSYTAHTKGLELLNYWDRLKSMGMLSVQRRFQRYKIIYLWKIVTGKTHNFGINWTKHPRWGLMIDIVYPKYYKVNSKAWNNWRQSLGVDGALLFNNLPFDVRNYSGDSLSGFKMKLDQTLETIPDCPVSQGLFPAPINQNTGRNSNCLIDWCKHLRLNNRGMDADSYIDDYSSVSL